MTLHPERNEARIPRSHTEQERYDLEMMHLNAVIQHLKELQSVFEDMLGHTVGHGNKIIQVPPPPRTFPVVNAVTGGLSYCKTTIPQLEQHFIDLKAKR